jgi:hypothetical protein
MVLLSHEGNSIHDIKVIYFLTSIANDLLDTSELLFFPVILSCQSTEAQSSGVIAISSLFCPLEIAISMPNVECKWSKRKIIRGKRVLQFCQSSDKNTCMEFASSIASIQKEPPPVQQFER